MTFKDRNVDIESLTNWFISLSLNWVLNLVFRVKKLMSERLKCNRKFSEPRCPRNLPETEFRNLGSCIIVLKFISISLELISEQLWFMMIPISLPTMNSYKCVDVRCCKNVQNKESRYIIWQLFQMNRDHLVWRSLFLRNSWHVRKIIIFSFLCVFSQLLYACASKFSITETSRSPLLTLKSEKIISE